MDVPTVHARIPDGIYVSKPRFANTVLNKYNPHTMAAEILRGLGGLNYPDRGIIRLSDERYFDPQASHTGAMTRDQAISVRNELDRISSMIRQCNVFLFTLGLTETWFDSATGIPFNQINPTILRPIRDRLEFHNLNVTEAYKVMADALTRLHESIENIKVVITVSPVPLLQTFTSNDIVSANSYSKSTLRCAAQMLANEFDFVDYFPSYEMVLHSKREFAWARDQAHVTDGVVQNVIATFIQRYMVSDPMS